MPDNKKVVSPAAIQQLIDLITAALKDKVGTADVTDITEDKIREMLKLVGLDPDSPSVNLSEVKSHLTNKNNPHEVSAASIGAVPNTRTINGVQLNKDITLDASTLGIDSIPTGGSDGDVLQRSGSSVEWGPRIGKSLTGQRVSITSTSTKTAGTGAEIFNDYRDRTFSGTMVTAGNISSGDYSHAEGYGTTTSGNYAHSEGRSTTASGSNSHAEGMSTTASGSDSHAEGSSTKATSFDSHAEGSQTEASGNMSHAEGNLSTASGHFSHAEGYQTTASGENAHSEGGWTYATNFASHACGHRNRSMTTGGSSENKTGDAFVIGNGALLESSPSNAFRVTYAGAVYGGSGGSFNGSGADYAEYFEWDDGNPNNDDRVGYFVTMNGDKIAIANPDDYLLGVVSGQPCIIGNADEDWMGRWQKDEFDRYLKRDVETPVTEIKYEEKPVLDDDGNDTGETKIEPVEVPTGEVIHGWDYVPNPDYDDSQQYTERKDRQEWDAVGMIGVLSVRDNGKCKVNSYCKCGEGGIAVPADGHGYNTYRVIKRVSESVIKIIFR